MKFLLMYGVVLILVACADSVDEPGDMHHGLHRAIRALGGT